MSLTNQSNCTCTPTCTHTDARTCTCTIARCGLEVVRVLHRLEEMTAAEFELVCFQTWFRPFVTPTFGVALIDIATNRGIAGWVPMEIAWLANEVLNAPVNDRLVLPGGYGIGGDDLCVFAMFLQAVAELQQEAMADGDEEDDDEGWV